MLNKKFIATALALATAAGLLATEISEAVLARVGTDTVITSYDVRVQAAQLESKLPPKMDSRKRMEAVAEIRSNVLDEMIVTELVWLDFQSLRGKIPMDIVQSRIDRLIQSEAGSDEDRFRDMLHRENMTYNEFVEKVKKQLAVEMLLYDRTRRNIFVTDKQIDEYFALHRPEFTTNVRHHLLAILLPQEGDWRETFDTLKARIRAGEDFASLAKAFSKGANAEEGGDLGWIGVHEPRTGQGRRQPQCRRVQRGACPCRFKCLSRKACRQGRRGIARTHAGTPPTDQKGNRKRNLRGKTRRIQENPHDKIPCQEVLGDQRPRHGDATGIFIGKMKHATHTAI